MKDKMFLFPALILVLTPCVWYSNQPGVDGIQGIDFLLSPGCFLATAIAVIGWLLRKEAICLIGNLLFIPTMLLFVYRQGQIFEGNSYSAMTLISGLSAWGIAVIGIAVQDALFPLCEWQKKHEKRRARRRSEFRRRFCIKKTPRLTREWFFLVEVPPNSYLIPINPNYSSHPTYRKNLSKTQSR